MFMWQCVCGSGFFLVVFFFQAEDGIRDLVRSRGLGDVYKRQDSAQVIGQVELADDASVWFGAVIRGDSDSIRVGLSLIHI